MTESNRLCTDCLCKVPKYEVYTPKDLLRGYVFQPKKGVKYYYSDYCINCGGFTIEPIPPIELGMNSYD